MRRLLTVALLTVFAVLGLAQPAFAHNTLISSNPADKASVDEAPEAVTLTFNDTVQPGPGNQIVVSGPGGTTWTEADAEVEVDGTKASVELPPLGPAGKYTIGYRILSADGHVVQDQLSFTLTKPGAGVAAPSSEASTPDDQAKQPADQPAGEDSGGLPLWVWIVGAVVLLGAGLVFALRLGKDQG